MDVADEFRARLRVLLVDDDRVSLILIAKQLRLCSYNVTTVMHSEVAMEMLRARRDSDDQFDLVITDLHMPGLDGFKLLELIGLEMDIPVIMLSANDALEAMIKGIQHGARDYLVKPVRLEQLKHLCIHAVAKVKDDPSNYNNSNDNDDQIENGANQTMKCSRKKRKDGENNENTSTRKRQRIQWSGALHRKFVQVINYIGLDKAVPKKILDMMNVEGLTREHIASHLQKYRLYMKKLSSGTFKGSYPFSDDSVWSEGDSININGQEHFEHNLEHGQYQPSLPFAGSSNSSNNPFASLSYSGAFGTQSLLPTHSSVQLMNHRNLGGPSKGMGPTVGYGGNTPQIVMPAGSQPGMINFTSTGNSNANTCFPSGPSGSSFANTPTNGMPFNTSIAFPSGTPSNSFANNGSLPLVTSMDPHLAPFKSNASLFCGKFEDPSEGMSFDNGDSFQSIGGVEMLPPSINLPMQPPVPAAPFDGLSGSTNSQKTEALSKCLDLHGGTAGAGPSQGTRSKINRLSRLIALSGQKSEFQNRMAELTRTPTPMAGLNEQVQPFNTGSNTNSAGMLNDNSAPAVASSAVSNLPNLQMDKPVMLSQMLNVEGEGGLVDQVNNNNESVPLTDTDQNVTNDALLDDFFGDAFNQDILTDPDAFMVGDWEIVP